MTRAELTERILRALDEDPDAPVFWSNGHIHQFLQDAQEILAEETRALKRSVTLVRTPGALLYSLHALGEPVMAPYRLYVPSLDRRLEAVVYSDLDAIDETWLTHQNPPEYWFRVSWDVFGIWPAASTGGEIIQIDSLVWPRALLDDGDEPEFPWADHDGLVLYGVYEGLMKRWDVARATQVLARFLESYGLSMARSGFTVMRERHWQRQTNPLPLGEGEGVS